MPVSYRRENTETRSTHDLDDDNQAIDDAIMALMSSFLLFFSFFFLLLRHLFFPVRTQRDGGNIACDISLVLSL